MEMNRHSCRIRNLRTEALSYFMGEEDALAAGGQYLHPDASGWLNAAGMERLCIVCENCGSIVVTASGDGEFSCPDCGDCSFRVIHTPHGSSSCRRPETEMPEVIPPGTEEDKDKNNDAAKGCGCLVALLMGFGGVMLIWNDWKTVGWILLVVAVLGIIGLVQPDEKKGS